ncbi:MAG TPA: DsbA family oxidoreductase [Nocardioidaceae bacterium]|nr:DsbA family oxidoreductase [Nocardioidaceae bacterium]
MPVCARSPGTHPSKENAPVKVEIWSDVVCPWCYIGKRRFEAALSRFPHRDQVEVEWKSFELDPGARSAAAGEDGPGYADRLAKKYSTTRDDAQKMLDSMTLAAAAEGLDFRFDLAVRANTFEAHQVIHLAAARGVQDQVKERLLRAYFTEGEPVGDRPTLVRLAAETGLEAAEVEKALEEQEYAEAVRADESEAGSLGISGVPFFVVDRKYGVSGAQPAEQLLPMLQRAWDESRPPLTMVAVDEAGDACGPDGCAI